MKRAKYIGAVSYGWEHTDLIYEYKGRQYFVTKHNNGYAFDPLYKQHQEAQKIIDATIEHQSDPICKWEYKGSADEGLDVFWEYVNKE